MSSSSPVDRGYLRHSASQARILCVCVMVCAAVLFSADMVKAQDASQDVAQAARQARARKAEQAQRDSHVYTNEDLQRPRIVLDNDAASVAARKPGAALPSTTDAWQFTTTSSAERGIEENYGESLGEVARRYRREKAARQAETASKDDSASPFHMERKMVAQPALAAMAPKLIVVLPSPVAEPKKNNSVSRAIAVKRDPFQRPGSGAPQTQMRRSEAHANSVKADSPGATLVPGAASPVKPTKAVANGFLPKASAPVEPSKEKSGGPILSPRTLPDAPVVMTEMVTMRPGDSLWKLSRQYLGGGSRWQEWVRSNPALRDAQKIRAGTMLAVPSSATRTNLEAKPARSATELVIRGGDSLWKISVARFGSGRFWTCLLTANPALRDASLIYPGQTLQVPQSCGEERRSPRIAVP